MRIVVPDASPATAACSSPTDDTDTTAPDGAGSGGAAGGVIAAAAVKGREAISTKSAVLRAAAHIDRSTRTDLKRTERIIEQPPASPRWRSARRRAAKVVRTLCSAVIGVAPDGAALVISKPSAMPLPARKRRRNAGANEQRRANMLDSGEPLTVVRRWAVNVPRGRGKSAARASAAASGGSQSCCERGHSFCRYTTPCDKPTSGARHGQGAPQVMKSIWSWVLSCGLLLTPLAVEAKTTVLHTPSSPDVGPFPADILTANDSAQKTGRRVNLPEAPACLGSDLVSCEVVKGLLNQLDGFSVKPQIRVCFSGPIDTTTLRAGIAMAPADGSGPATGVNQVFYDQTTLCAMVKPEHVLDQSTQLPALGHERRPGCGGPVGRGRRDIQVLRERHWVGVLRGPLARPEAPATRSPVCERGWRLCVHNDERHRLDAKGAEVSL